MKVGELFASLGLEVDEGSFALGERALSGIKTAIGALAVMEGVKKLEEMVRATSETAEHALKAAEKLGITSDAVQELGYAAEVNKVPAQQLEGALMRMTRAMDQAQTKGKGPFADAMKKLGISMSDPDIKSKNLDFAFSRIADGFADLPEGANKTAIAMQLFGRTGAALIPMLNRGRDGIKELRDEAWDLGVVIDHDVAKKFEEWEEQITRVKGAATGLRNDAVIALLPQLRELTDQLFVWIKANRELIKQRLEQVMQFVVQAMVGLSKALGVVYGIFEKMAPVIQNVAGALGELLGVSDDASNTMEMAALAVGAAWVIANLPVLLMLGLVAAAILLIDDIWEGLNGGDSATKELLEAFEKNLGESGVGRVLLGIKASAKAVFDYLEEKIKWLIDAGHTLGNLFFDMTHGSTQQQVDDANGLSFQERVFRQMGMRNGNSGIDKVVQAPSGIDKVVNPEDLANARAGQDRVLRFMGLNTGGTDPQQPESFNPTLLGGIDKINRAPALPAILDNNYFAPISGPTPIIQAPQMSVTIHVSSDTDEQIPRDIEAHIRGFFEGAMRDGVIGTGGGGNKLP